MHIKLLLQHEIEFLFERIKADNIFFHSAMQKKYIITNY